jgi:sugar O-acyltransferase (sialic acid O-acetyltransferase NeuD family)
MKRLIIIGGGNGALEVMGILDDINNKSLTYEIIGILDDDSSLHGTKIGEILVLGGLDKSKSYSGVRFVFAIGSINTQHKRLNIFERTKLLPDDFEKIIHPSAKINKTAKIGRGCIIHPGVTLGNNVSLGDFIVLAVNTTLGPYSYVGDFSLITSHVLLLSHVNIGRFVFIGSMSCVIEKIKIGSHARIGLGSVVGRDVKENMVAIGNPLRLLGINS